MWETVFLSTLFTFVILKNIYIARKYIFIVQLQTTTWVTIALGCFVFLIMAYTLKPDFGGYTVAILASIMLITSNTSVGISREGIHILYGKGSLVKRVKWDKVDHAELINKQSRTRLKVTLKSNSSFFPKPKIQHFYPIQDYDAIYDLFEEKKIRFDI